VAFFYEVKEKNKIVIAYTKQAINPDDFVLILSNLIDFEIVKDKFGVFDLFVTEKQINLIKNLINKK
jgi:hypothetical protein